MLETQTVAAAGSFTGAGATGLIDFQVIRPDLLNSGRETTAVITSIALDNNSNSQAIPTVNCFLMQRGDTPASSLNRITIARPTTDAPGFARFGCRIPVPRSSVAGNPVWVLVLITGVLVTDTTWTVAWEIGPAVNA